MLPVKFRLTRDKDFKKISASGKSFFSPLFRVRTLPNNLAHSRFAFIVTTKTSKKAIVRNRIKRQVREIVRLKHEGANPGYDIVVTIKTTALNKAYQELEKDLLKLLAKAKVL